MQTEEGRILCKYVPNYRINLVDAGNISDLGMFHTDLQQILGVLKYRQDKKELKDYIYENRDYFARVDVETYQALRAFLHSENMLKDFAVSGGKNRYVSGIRRIISGWSKRGARRRPRRGRCYDYIEYAEERNVCLRHKKIHRSRGKHDRTGAEIYGNIDTQILTFLRPACTIESGNSSA